MPRTKVPRNVMNNKRIRENNADLEEILRDYDIEVENSIQLLQMEYTTAIRVIDSTIEELKTKIPAHILCMKLSDAMKLKDFNDVLVEEKMKDLNCTVKGTVEKADEGYLTEELSSKSRMTSDNSENEIMKKKSFYQNVSIVGSLKTVKTRRRSQSASNAAITPGPRTMMSAAKGRTPVPQQLPVPHASRTKYRTPLSTMRQKAVSADRINTITPKVNPLNPMSMLRHARAGEAVFSLTGSPIVPSNMTESTANVNIPVRDGILSIRPEYMDPSSIDPSIMHKIDPQTFKHLRTLKANLDVIMAGFNNKFKH